MVWVVVFGVMLDFGFVVVAVEHAFRMVVVVDSCLAGVEFGGRGP